LTVIEEKVILGRAYGKQYFTIIEKFKLSRCPNKYTITQQERMRKQK
jgi:hypothetical protein